MAEERRGLLLGAAAFGMWGLFPLYWPLLEPADATEILAHRVLWSLIVMAALVIATRRVAALRAVWASGASTMATSSRPRSATTSTRSSRSCWAS